MPIKGCSFTCTHLCLVYLCKKIFEEVTPNKDGSQVISMAVKRVSRGFTADYLVSYPPSSPEPHQEKSSRGSGSPTCRHRGAANQPPTGCLPPAGWTQFDHQIIFALLAYISLYEKKVWRCLTYSYTPTSQIKSFDPGWSMPPSIRGGMQAGRVGGQPSCLLSGSLQLSQIHFLEALRDSTYPAHPQSQWGSWRIPEPWICFKATGITYKDALSNNLE